MDNPPVLKNPTMPAIPELFSKIMPVDLPQLTYGNAGFFHSIGHNLRLKRINKSAKLEAEIAEYRERETMANSRSIMEAVTFGPRVMTALKAEQHKQDMMDLEKKHTEAILAQEVYKAQLLGGEVKDFELTFSHKLALFKKEEEACLTE